MSVGIRMIRRNCREGARQVGVGIRMIRCSYHGRGFVRARGLMGDGVEWGVRVRLFDLDLNSFWWRGRCVYREGGLWGTAKGL